MKKWFAIILCMALALSGCSQTESAENRIGEKRKESVEAQGEASREKEGGYVEREIPLPELSEKESILDVKLDKEGVFKVFSKEPAGDGLSLYYMYKKPAGADAEWKREELSWVSDAEKRLNSEKKEDEYIFTNIFEGEDQNLYAFVQIMLTESTEEGQFSIRFDAKSETFLYKEGENSFVRLEYQYPGIGGRMFVMENGNFAIEPIGSRTAELYSGKTGKKLGEVDLGETCKLEGESFYTAASGNCLIGKGKEEVLLLDTETGKPVRSVPYPFEENNELCFAAGTDGTLILADKNGLHRVTDGGTLWETLLEGWETSFGLGAGSLSKLFILGNGDEFAGLLSLPQGGGEKLLSYVWDENKPAPGNSLTVYSLHYSEYVEDAVKKYQLEHRDLKVNYVIGNKEDVSLDGDYIRALNTELLNGKGPDILFLDGLPSESYIQKGALADLGSFVKPREASGELLSNLISPYERDGKLYRLPLRFRVPFAIGEKGAVDSMTGMDAIADYIKQNGDTCFMRTSTYEGAASLMLSLSWPELFGRKDAEPEEMKAFLENLKVLSDNIKALDRTSVNLGVNRDRESPAGVDVECYSPSILEEVMEGRARLMIMPLAGSVNIMDMTFARERGGKASRLINRTFMPELFIGINQKSREPEQAAAFLEYLLDEPPEGMYRSFPINAEALKRDFESDHGVTYRELKIQGEVCREEPAPLEDRMEVLRQFETLETPIEVEQDIFDIAVERAVAYLSGKTTSEQAAQEICEKVRLYRSE